MSLTHESVAAQVRQLASLKDAIGQAIVGQHEVVEQLLIGLLAGGHCLLEGVPGLGKTLLVRTYSGALAQVKDQTVQLKPMRASPEDTEVVVKTEVRGETKPAAPLRLVRA